ncbi:FAD-linked oxidase C-terminal domain-containing protein [Nonomuraea sp. NPDC050404]|uniref:FAD-linked oxidase C-terminal domain-containing protein n=1 Tax=Nonomuraea sp. NPDC050404 TaxID=3155783 RepID=UPI0033EE1ED2
MREAVRDVARSHGVTSVFGNPGSAELPMLDRFPADLRVHQGIKKLLDPLGILNPGKVLPG